MKKFLPILLLCMATAAAAQAGDLKADIPAAGLQRVQLEAGSGEAVLRPAADNAVHVHLTLEQQEYSLFGLFHWMSESTSRDLAGATLKLTREGTGLRIAVVYPSGDEHNDVKEHWIVQLPANLLLAASMRAGRLEIDGMRAGVEARLKAGVIALHLAGGPVEASVGAGRLHVISDTTQPGKLYLSSTFGLAALSLNGKLYAPPPKEFHFFGNSESRQLPGKDDMNLKVTAGEVDLRVGQLVEFHDYRGLFDDSDT